MPLRRTARTVADLSVRPFDQTTRQLQVTTQFGFARLHFAPIALVIVARQMQQSVKDENFQFSLGGMAQ